MLVREFTDGPGGRLRRCSSAPSSAVSRRGGGEYLRVSLGDRSGAVVAMVWDDVDTVAELVGSGAIVHVQARFERHQRYGPQLVLRACAPRSRRSIGRRTSSTARGADPS